MSKDELKKIIDEALETDSAIDAVNPPEVAVYTQVWFIDFKQIDAIRAKGVNLINVSVEGYHLTLRVKL